MPVPHLASVEIGILKVDFVMNRIQDLKSGLERQCESAFFDDMPMMMVTSSPIDGKQCENRSSLAFRCSPSEDNPTWSELLSEFKTISVRDEKHLRNKDITVEESVTTETDTFSSYEPIAEHKMKILVNSGKKIQVISSSARKTHFRNQTPKKPTSYSALSQQYHHQYENECDNHESEESIQTIKKRIQNTEDLSARDIERYEKILKKVINQNKMKKNARTLVEDSDLIRLIEDKIGPCSLSPRTVRIIEKQSQYQEKKLISLSIAKRKSAAEIQKKIKGQLIETKQQIKNREELEVKQVKAAHLRHEAIVTGTLFNQAHAAHHRKFVTESRQKDDLSQLKSQMQNEKIKNSTQISKVIQDIWKTFLQEQYNELRKDVREQNLQKVGLFKESEEQLERLKKNYEEKLKELKDIARTKSVEAGMEKKEIRGEIERIQRKLQHQFQEEFQTLLRNVQTKGDHKRFIRKEKAHELKKKLQKGDYVFDV